jgi:hypothetical protein
MDVILKEGNYILDLKKVQDLAQLDRRQEVLAELVQDGRGQNLGQRVVLTMADSRDMISTGRAKTVITLGPGDYLELQETGSVRFDYDSPVLGKGYVEVTQDVRGNV